jgi:dCMP deaminase
MSDVVLNRPGWDDYFFSIAKVVASRATCPARQVGCVVIDRETKAILSTGYNGAPRGTEHCTSACATRQSGSDFRKCHALHGELNAILNAAYNGMNLKGSVMYLTTTPCVFCSRAIVQAGISEVRAMSKYPHEDALELLRAGGVDVYIIQGVTLPFMPKFADVPEVEVSVDG